VCSDLTLSASLSDGTYYEYYENGNIRIEPSYENNTLTKTKAFDEDGNVAYERKH
jgi:antitoxin component YwqK of YwqJK toxin-antitoxin module